MIKEFNNLKKIKKYYNKKTNTYIFKEKGDYIDFIIFNFDLDIEANIDAHNIKANNINANNIDCLDITANHITANNINVLDIKAWDITARNINACDINACDINAGNIKALDIIALDIMAKDIIYYAICFVYKNIKCKSIKGERENHKYFVLDGKLEIEGAEENDK